MRAPREQDTVRACLQLLQLRGIFAWRNNSGAFVLGRARNRRFFRAGTPGGSDILGVLPGGRFLAVEVKRPRGMPTPRQQMFLAAVEAAGGVAVVIRDVGELAALLNGPGDFPKPRAPGGDTA
jgi:hypothetical protein